MYDSDKLEELRERAGNIGKPIQEVLINDICRRIRKTGAITSSAEYQIYRAEALGLAEKELKAAIAKELNAAEDAIDLLFQDLANETVMFEQNKQLHQLIEGYGKITKQAVADNFKNIWLPAPNGKLYTVKQAYAKIIDFAFFETASGTFNFNTSVRQATKELIKRGVRTIPRDNKGSLRIEYAVRSYITNRMGELHNEISQMNFDKIGADGWEITAHAAPAPDHAPYQGRQYLVKEFNLINNALERKFGQYGCMHLLSPIKVGISPPAYSDAKLQKYLDDNSKGVSYKGQKMTLYEAKQQRNSFESLISGQKYEVLAAAGDEKWTQEMQIKLGRMRQEYAYYCKETNQKMRPDKIYVGGFGKSEASKASWGYRKTLAKTYSDKQFSIKAVTDKSIQSVPKVFGNTFTEAQAINLQIAHRALLQAVQKLEIGTEIGQYLGADMKPVSDYVIGKIGTVRMPSSPTNAKGLIHNHPSGELFSLDDISRFTVDANLDILTAVGNDGSLYILEKAENYNFSKIQELYIKLAFKNSANSDNIQAIITEREAMLNVFERFGLNYRAIRAIE